MTDSDSAPEDVSFQTAKDEALDKIKGLYQLFLGTGYKELEWSLIYSPPVHIMSTIQIRILRL